jgi:hypothetical protein
MLKWRPANTYETVLCMQRAIVQYPNVVDWRQCHYYVTLRDIAAELNKPEDALTRGDIDSVLGGPGLRLDQEVYDISLRGEDTTGFFVPESALVRSGIELPSWGPPLPSAVRSTRQRGRGS